MARIPTSTRFLIQRLKPTEARIQAEATQKGHAFVSLGQALAKLGYTHAQAKQLIEQAYLREGGFIGNHAQKVVVSELDEYAKHSGQTAHMDPKAQTRAEKKFAEYERRNAILAVRVAEKAVPLTQTELRIIAQAKGSGYKFNSLGEALAVMHQEEQAARSIIDQIIKEKGLSGEEAQVQISQIVKDYWRALKRIKNPPGKY
jgi:diaminopimelate decarboxylase